RCIASEFPVYTLLAVRPSPYGAPFPSASTALAQTLAFIVALVLGGFLLIPSIERGTSIVIAVHALHGLRPLGVHMPTAVKDVLAVPGVLHKPSLNILGGPYERVIGRANRA